MARKTSILAIKQLKTPSRGYRRRFIVVCEGKKTEPGYFGPDGPIARIVGRNVCVRVHSPKRGSAPEHVLSEMKRCLERDPLEKSDAAWLVVDRDEWPEGELNKLVQWAKKGDQHHLALSNPKFEYWLLLHFESGQGVTTPAACDTRLKEYLPNDDKGIPTECFPRAAIDAAVVRAEKRLLAFRNEPWYAADDWPRASGLTTVHRLARAILAAYVDTAGNNDATAPTPGTGLCVGLPA
ncbi:MAG: RloB domain-containing protein [Magnetococcales bacterium]|nr:RloB domain-containing protein [Magnetococcales bacterium]